MFSENHKKTGCIEVVCGSMFSGKTEELIRRLRRAQFANQTIAIFKPSVDKRYSEVEVVSHDFHKITSTPISKAVEMLSVGEDVQVVGVDEAQFFDESLVDVCQQLADRGKRVIVAGLDTDYLGKPFGPIPMLMAVAEEFAGAAGYRFLYLETHTNLEAAIGLYEKLGFRRIEKPETVLHSTMNRFFWKDMEPPTGENL